VDTPTKETEKPIEVAQLQLVDEVSVVIAGEKVSEDTALKISTAFAEFSAQADVWLEKAKQINVTSIDQKDDMKLARESRLAIRQIRINVDKTRKTLKDDAQAYVRAVDAAGRKIRETLEPIEAQLKEHEEFAIRYEAEQREKLATERSDKLEALGMDPRFYNLVDMSEEDFAVVLQQAEDAHTAKVEREKRQAEEAEARARAESEERERIRKENERLKAEAEERERKAEAERIEREKAEAEARAAREAEEAEKQAKHKKVVGRQLAMHEYDGKSDYDWLASLSETDFQASLQVAKETFEFKQKEAERKEAERQAELKKEQAAMDLAIARMKELGKYGVHLELAQVTGMDEGIYQAKLQSARGQFEAEQRQLEEDRIAREKAEAEAKDAREAKERSEREAQEEAARKLSLAINDAAQHAAEIVIETAESWASRHPRTKDGKSRCNEAVIVVLNGKASQ